MPTLGIVDAAMLRLKEKTLFWGCCLAFSALWPLSVEGASEDLVLLAHASAEPFPSELVLALRIQLTGAAGVRTYTHTPPPSMTARVETASALARAQDALLVVWVEDRARSVDGFDEAVLYVVGKDRSRALLEVVRVAGEHRADMDRTLALKVREIVEQQQALGKTNLATPRLLLEPRPKPSEAVWGASALLGLAAGTQKGTASGQWGARLGAGPQYTAAEWRLSGFVELMLLPEVEVQRSGASVGVQELAPGLLLRAQSKQGPLWLGLRSFAMLSFISALGRSRAGLQGEANVRVASLGVGAEVELPLSGGLGIGLAVDLQARLRRQRFAIEEQVVADLGNLRPLGLLALTWSAQ